MSVGVFIDEKIERITSLVNNHIIDMIQLHGKEDSSYIRQLKKKVSCPIIKAIRINNEEDMKNIHYDVDYYLLDGVTPGSGEPFDWTKIQDLDRPFFLAGGINIENVHEALKINCMALDTSSGAETNGKKDPKKIREMIRRVRNER